MKKIIFLAITLLAIILWILKNFVSVSTAQPRANWSEVWVAIEVTGSSPIPSIRRTSVGDTWISPLWGNWEEIIYSQFEEERKSCTIQIENTFEIGGKYDNCTDSPVYYQDEQTKQHPSIDCCNIGGVNTDHRYNDSLPKCKRGCSPCASCSVESEQYCIYSNTTSTIKIKKTVERNRICVYPASGYYVYAYYPKYYKTTNQGSQPSTFTAPPTVTTWSIKGEVGN